MNTTPQEIHQSKLIRDTRQSSTRFYQAIFSPERFKYVLIGFLILQLWIPALWHVWLIVLGCLLMIHSNYKFQMPLRMPRDIGGIDKSDYQDESYEGRNLLGFRTKYMSRRYNKASGILYLGETRSDNPSERGRELWISDSDARTHMMMVGTTGSGKTETLLGLAYNALCWGSGFCYADGKADSSLGFSLWSLARKMGREDDFLVLNYLKGGYSDKNILNDGKSSQTNTLNPFADGTADFVLQLLTSLLPASGGDSANWQEKAINMMAALITVLCYKRDRGELTLSIEIIRHYLNLVHMVELYKEGLKGYYPELTFQPLRTYFEASLPGFRSDQVNDIEEWDKVVFEQHGYLTGQFARMLSMMIDNYSDIFSNTFPEIDMQDVLLNNRILVVLIPSLEKSSQETAALGKLYISAIKLMMARNLGHTLEGKSGDILDSKASNFPYPNIIISDELSYYFGEGIGVMFAQARSLGFMMIAAMQDVQGLYKVNKEEANIIFANTKIKWSLALEDGGETYEIINKAAGNAHFSVLAGYETTTGMLNTSFKTQSNIDIQRLERIKLSELKGLNPGEGMMVFKDRVICTRSLYIQEHYKRSAVLPMQINRFLQVKHPNISKLPDTAISKREKNNIAVKRVAAMLRNNERPSFPSLHDPILTGMVQMSNHLDKIQKSMPYTPEERGQILLCEAMKQLDILKKIPSSSSPWHSPNYSIEDDEDKS